MEKYIFRGKNSGVFYGELKERQGQEVVINNCRRLWYWEGACSISELALTGTAKPEKCNFTVTVEQITILDCIEIIICTKEAIKSIDGVKIWKTK